MKLPRRPRLRRPRYADVAATLALVFAMSGTAYAVAKLPPDSVDTQSIQDQAVTGPKIKVNAIGTGRVANETLLGDDIADGALSGADVQDGSIGNADLGVDSVQAIQIADNTIDSGEIINGSLTGIEIADGTLDSADLGSSSVGTSEVADNSIGLVDLVGANVSGSISFSLSANSCGTLSLGVGGAAVGEAVIMSYTGTVGLPPGVVFSPFRVVSAGTINARACNVLSSSVSVSSIGVRFVTFG